MAKQPPVQEKMGAEQRASILERLGASIAGKRKQAIAGRAASGIEQIWQEDDEFYQGFDDANRHEFKEVKSKPTEGGRDVTPRKHTGSTLFPNITGPYVDAAAAKVADMLLPTDERNFAVDPSPVPDILDEEEGWPKIDVAPPAGQPMAGMGALGGMLQAAQQNAAQIMANPAQAAKTPEQRLADLFAKMEAVRQKAIDAAEKAEDQIDDYLVECNYARELRKVIEDAARIGTGVLKGPFPEKRKVKVWATNPQTGERELVVKIETKPGSKRVSPEDVFPDFPACGEDIHHGSFIFERDHLSRKKLTDLKGGVGAAKYLDRQIDAALEEGPKTHDGQDSGSRELFTLWHFYGTVTGEDMVAAGCDCDDMDKQYPVLITMVNDRVIKAALNPLDSGEFPYDMLPWKNRSGMPWGSGVGRQGRTAQRVVVAATRNLMDNAGASAKPHKVMTDAIEQDGDPWTWRVQSELGAADVRNAMQFFIQPSLQSELMQIIAMGEKMMELHTGLPMIILGMQGNVEETAHGRALQNNNGSTVMRRIARNFDGYITEPHIRRYHAWLMLYSEDDSVKGDFQIKARGSAALVERDIQNQQLPVVVNMSLNPAFEKDPVLAFDEMLKSQRFDPKQFALTDERKKELASRQAPPPPIIAATQMKEQGATERKKMDLADKQADRQHEAQQNDMDRALEKMQNEIDAQLGAANLSAEQQASLNGIKADLSGIVLKINAQKQLTPGPQMLTPPTEPPQRAPNGLAYAQ